MIVDCISDLHGATPILGGGDLLILAGDYTRSDEQSEYLIFRQWLQKQDYRHKVLIGGNHDMALFDGRFYFNEEWFGAKWLNDSGCEIEGLKIWGSPWTAWFDGINPDCTAWTLKGDSALAKKWALIPEDTDILITHSPSKGVLDFCMNEEGYISAGSESLRVWIDTWEPQLHVFGHIHEGSGLQQEGNTLCANASIMDENYRPSNKPIRIEL